MKGRLTRLVIVAVVAVAVGWLGFANSGSAQPIVPVARYTGTIASVECNSLSFVLDTATGPVEFQATRLTIVRLGFEFTHDLCSLRNFIGAQAIVFSTPVSGLQIAGRVDVLVFPASGVTPSVGPDRNGDGPFGGTSGSSTGGTTGGTTGTPEATTGGTTGGTTGATGGTTGETTGGTTGGGTTGGTTGSTTGGTTGGHGEHGNSGKSDNNSHGEGFEQSHEHSRH